MVRRGARIHLKVYGREKTPCGHAVTGVGIVTSEWFFQVSCGHCKSAMRRSAESIRIPQAALDAIPTSLSLTEVEKKAVIDMCEQEAYMGQEANRNWIGRAATSLLLKLGEIDEEEASRLKEWHEL